MNNLTDESYFIQTRQAIEELNILSNPKIKLCLLNHWDEVVWWRNACVLYFQTFSKIEIPAQYEKPDKSLGYYKSLKFEYTPNRHDQ